MLSFAEMTDGPSFRLLDDAQLERLHEASVAILEDPGVRITTDEARSLLVKAGSTLRSDDVVSIPARLVEEARASAPGAFALHSRDAEERLLLGEGNVYFGSGTTALNYLDPATRETRDFTLEDFEDVARLTDAMPNIEFVTTPGVVRPSKDLPLGLVNQHEFLALVTNTTKPLMVLLADRDALSDVFEMAEAVAGGREELRRRPFVVPYLNPVSPLLFNPETLDKLLLSAEWGIPVVCQSAPQVGATAPVTLAGAAALANAETLAGLVLSQLKREATPFITGVVPMVVDMRSGNAAGGGPVGALLMIAAAELARFYGLPLVGVGGGGDSKLADEQAAAELTFYAFASTLAGVDLVFDVGSIEAGLMHSPEVILMADEIAEMCRSVMRGFDVDDEHLAMDMIRSVGIGEQYLGEQHTLRHFRELWTPALLSWEDRREWTDAGSKTMGDRARERIAQILAGHHVDELPAEVMDAMRSVIDARRREIAAGS